MNRSVKVTMRKVRMKKVKIICPTPVEIIVLEEKQKKRAKRKFSEKRIVKTCDYCKKDLRYDRYVAHSCKIMPTCCFHCGKNFPFPYLKKRHEKAHVTLPRSEKIKCVKCSKVFTRRDNMLRHVKSTCKRIKMTRK